MWHDHTHRFQPVPLDTCGPEFMSGPWRWTQAGHGTPRMIAYFPCCVSERDVGIVFDDGHAWLAGPCGSLMCIPVDHASHIRQPRCIPIFVHVLLPVHSRPRGSLQALTFYTCVPNVLHSTHTAMHDFLELVLKPSHHSCGLGLLCFPQARRDLDHSFHCGHG